MDTPADLGYWIAGMGQTQERTSTESQIPRGFVEIDCPGCGSHSWKVLRQGSDWELDRQRILQVVRCDACGLHYTNPRPTLECLGDYYPPDYSPYHHGPEKHRPLSPKWLVLRSAYGSPAVQPRGIERLAAAAARMIRSPRSCGDTLVPFHGQGRLLDFGCGSGKFLQRMAILGWNVTGLDFSPSAVEAVRNLGIAAYQGTLPHPQLQPESFDVISMRQALEHVPDPRQILLAAHELLAPRGLIFITVPNFASWEIDYFDDAAMTLDLPRHLLHFTPQTLGELLNRTGYHVRELSQRCREDWIRKSLSRVDRRQSKPMDRWLRIAILRQIISRWQQWQGRGNELTAIAQKS
jgi:2-polyprenyl-3-methyl-5-hydroxy-6-metoxy-1,4-benzoquinol methylase